MATCQFKKTDMFDLLCKNKFTIDTFLIGEVVKIIETKGKIKLQPPYSESLKQHIRSNLFSVKLAFSQFQEEKKQKNPEVFRKTLENHIFKIPLSSYDILPNNLAGQFEACKVRLDHLMKQNEMFENENKILKSQVKVLNEELLKKDKEAQEAGDLGSLKRKLDDNEIKTNNAIKIGTEALNAIFSQPTVPIPREWYEQQPQVKFGKYMHVRRKSYYDCGYRQQNRLKTTMKKMIGECSDYLKPMNVCFKRVVLFPLERDECDFKLDILQPDEYGSDDETPEVNKMLYYKDKFAIADKAYNELKSRCGLKIPSLYTLKNRRHEIDALFELHDNPKGVYVSVQAKLVQRVQAFFERKYKCFSTEDMEKVEGFNDNIIHVRFAGDGTNIGRNLKLLNLTFTILNEGQRARTANGNYTIGIYEIDIENYDSVSICFNEIVDELSRLTEINVLGKELKLVYYYACDWKMLAHCLGLLSANSKYPCVWCKCCKDDFADKSLEWSITDTTKGARSHIELIQMVQLANTTKNVKYGYDKLPIFRDIIPIYRYMIDMLHLFLRISDTLINLIVKDCSLADGFESWSISRFNVADYQRLNAFQEFLNNKCSVNFKFVWISDTKKLTWRDLVGPEKIRMFENFDLSLIYPEHDKYDLVSKLWKEFYDLIKGVKLVSIQHDVLKQRTADWLDLFLQIYNKTMVTPYIHAFVSHLHEFVKLYKDINAFNLQGLERLNELSTGQYFKGTNKRDSALHQMFRKRNRMEYLRLFVDDADMNN